MTWPGAALNNAGGAEPPASPSPRRGAGAGGATAALAATVLLLLGLTACRHRSAAAAFNGAWRLDVAASQNVPAMMVGHSNVIRITSAGDRFTLAYVFDGDPINLSTFTLDGRAHDLPLGENAVGRATATAQAGGREIRLVISRPAVEGLPAEVENIVFALQPGDQAIRRTRTVRGRSAPAQVYLYRRAD